MAIILKKTLIAVLSTVLFCVAMGQAAEPAQAAQAEYNYIALQNNAVNMDGEVWLPLRSTFNAMNMDVTWRADGLNKIKLTQGNETYELNLNKAGNQITLADGTPYPCKITQGTSYVPLRLFQGIVNRDIGLSGDQMLVLVDANPNWQLVSGTWSNQKPMWAHMNAYQKPEQAQAPATDTNAALTAPTPAVAEAAVAAPATVAAAPAVTGDQLIWPTTATYVSSPYGERVYPLGNGIQTDFHTGVDIAGVLGDPIFAAAAGTVTRAEVFSTYGNCIDITHPSGLVTRYAHLNDIHVVVGQQVAQGQTIGTQGKTGAATGPHLHFETRVGDKAVDPDAFIHYR